MVAGGLLRRGECHEQRHRRTGAEAEHGGGPGRDVAVGAAVERGLAGELLGTERDQVALVTEALARPRQLVRQRRYDAHEVIILTPPLR